MPLKAKVDTHLYGTVVVEADTPTELHKLVAGYERLNHACVPLLEKGADPEDLYASHVRMEGENGTFSYYKVREKGKEHEVTLGETNDAERFSLYPRDDAYWKPEDGEHQRPVPSTETEAPPEADSTPPENGQAEEEPSLEEMSAQLLALADNQAPNMKIGEVELNDGRPLSEAVRSFAINHAGRSPMEVETVASNLGYMGVSLVKCEDMKEMVEQIMYPEKA